MQYFNPLLSSNELRLIYRRLAILNHPDKGGNPEVMKRINIEYESIKKRLTNIDSAFNNICLGDQVIINQSISIVVAISGNTFTAKSEYSQRHAVFNKATGFCINNPKFKASIPKTYSYAFKRKQSTHRF